MRNFTTPLWSELTTEGGAKTISITPSAAIQPGRFMISGIEPRIASGERLYLTRLWPHLTTTFDPDAVGDAVNWDKLPKALSSLEVTADVFGVPYPATHTRGAVLGHLIQVIGLGYAYPDGARIQIPGSTDADVTLDIFYVAPFAHECLEDPMETAQWVGFYDGGTVDMYVAPSTVFDGDYAGAVIKAPTTLRCLAETQPSKKNFIGIPFQWRERQIAGGGSSPVLKNVGGETSLNGVSPGAGLAGCWWLSDATGIGLSGPDGVDNFLSISIPWRSQKSIQNLDGFYHSDRVQRERRVGPISGIGAGLALHDRAGWPNTMASTPNNRPSANSQAMFFPLVEPGRNLQTSKVQRVLGDLQVDFQVTTPITNPHRFVTWELMEFTPGQVQALAALGRFGGEARRRDPGGEGSPSQLRYTAYDFES